MKTNERLTSVYTNLIFLDTLSVLFLVRINYKIVTYNRSNIFKIFNVSRWFILLTCQFSFAYS